jgi:hypothetical protein
VNNRLQKGQFLSESSNSWSFSFKSGPCDAKVPATKKPQRQ